MENQLGLPAGNVCPRWHKSHPSPPDPVILALQQGGREIGRNTQKCTRQHMTAHEDMSNLVRPREGEAAGAANKDTNTSLKDNGDVFSGDLRGAWFRRRNQSHDQQFSTLVPEWSKF